MHVMDFRFANLRSLPTQLLLSFVSITAWQHLMGKISRLGTLSYSERAIEQDDATEGEGEEIADGL